jgi:homoserine kinase
VYGEGGQMRIKVPASIANLGPGFDCMAMAIDLWLEVEANESARPSWDYEGEGADYLYAHENPFSRLNMKGKVRSEIPMGVGLGSSAAARLAASALSSPWDVKSHIIDAGADEGHYDNVAASASGGIRIVSQKVDEKLPNPGWGVALFIANQPLPTEKARSVLPDEVPLADASFNAARTALLVRAITAKRPALLGEALRDRLHQPQRLHLYPWVEEVIHVAEAAGAYGAAICGAGPSVFAFCAPSQANRISNAMAEAHPLRGRALVTRITDKGMFRTL